MYSAVEQQIIKAHIEETGALNDGGMISTVHLGLASLNTVTGPKGSKYSLTFTRLTDIILIGSVIQSRPEAANPINWNWHW